MILPDTSKIPFKSASADTITFIACLNHIPNRQEVLKEARRLIKSKEKLIITMLDPILGNFGHLIWWSGEHNQRGGMAEGEVGGLWPSQVIELCFKADFNLLSHKRFTYGLNHLYIFNPN